MARCPNCARTVRFWHNYGGYCSKACRTDSITSCPNCGKVGLFKHSRLGCCSEECLFWYVASLLGYDKEALVTPAWDKVVYHVRLPSTSAEISSLQFDELEYDRASDTVLVIAAPPWMTRGKVLAELPYERFDNAAWQHLWADGTLTEDELFRFHRVCYDDDQLCQKLGEHVFAKLRQPAPSYGNVGPPPGYLDQIAAPALTPPRPVMIPQARIAAPAPAPEEFVSAVRAIFEERQFVVSPGPTESTLTLHRAGRTSLAAYYHDSGLSDVDRVQRAFVTAGSLGAATTYVVTNGRFSLQAEDFASSKSIQLIDGAEMAELSSRRHEMPTAQVGAELTQVLPARSPSSNGASNSDHHEVGEASPIDDESGATAPISMAGKSQPVTAEFVEEHTPADPAERGD